MENNAASSAENGSNWKSYVMIAGVGILLIFSFVQMIQISALQNGNSLSPATGAVSLSPASSGGETYDQMMARMHPDQVQQPSASGAASPQMVGGC